MYKIIFWHHPAYDDLHEILVYVRKGDENFAEVINKKGELELIKVNEYDKAPTLLKVNSEWLQAFADGLGERGIYPQKTNKDKIKAEAISSERKEQIDYLRGLSEKMIFKV